MRSALGFHGISCGVPAQSKPLTTRRHIPAATTMPAPAAARPSTTASLLWSRPHVPGEVTPMVCALMMVGLLCWAVVFDAGRITGRPTPDNPTGAGRSGAQGVRDDLGSCAEV